MAEKKEGKILLLEDESRKKLLEGARAAYEATKVSYGPRGKNVLLEKGFGRPILTRDGVTIISDVFFDDRAKNMGAQILTEASQTTNRNAGDGTTATVVLSYHLLQNSIKAINAGVHPMVVRDTLQEDSHKILEKLEELAIPVKDEQQLLVNANLPAELKLDEALNAKPGYGYNLRKDAELVDVIKDGVIDPVVVTREVIRNATSAIGGAVTVGASLIFVDTPVKE